MFPGVPRLYIPMNEAPENQDYDLSSIRACVSGASPLPLAVAKRFERGHRRRRWSRATASPRLARHAREPDVRQAQGRTRSVCRFPTRIEDRRSRRPRPELAQGERGELCLKGPRSCSAT